MAFSNYLCFWLKKDLRLSINHCPCSVNIHKIFLNCLRPITAAFIAISKSQIIRHFILVLVNVYLPECNFSVLLLIKLPHFKIFFYYILSIPYLCVIHFPSSSLKNVSNILCHIGGQVLNNSSSDFSLFLNISQSLNTLLRI